MILAETTAKILAMLHAHGVPGFGATEDKCEENTADTAAEIAALARQAGVRGFEKTGEDGSNVGP